MEATTRRRGPRIALSERQRALLDRPWKVKFLQGTILLVVLIGAATGPLALLKGGRSVRVQPAGASARPSTVAPAGFAELFVAAWLNQADPEHPETLAAFDPYVTADDLTGMIPGQLYAARSVAIDATPAGTDYWAITVAAEVLTSVKGSLRPAGTRYYGVGVEVTQGRYIATSLPEQISRPPAADKPELWVDEGLEAPAPTDPMADTLEQFFTAMLTGRGELDRYVDPKSGLVAFTPAPYTRVSLRGYAQRLFPSGEALVKAQVAGLDAAGHTTVLEYWLDLEQAQGRWEVARLHRAAPMVGLRQQEGGR
ncbi:MAG TPA: conjugal transfer protein [Actinomycetes bacterium]|jgi:hypothetical protein|nr:conjugal transfer protein [Actinomycetes bacterium]